MPVAREGLMPALPEWPDQSRMPAMPLATSLWSEIIIPNLTVGLRRRNGIGAFNPRLFY
jgi:hypothetical protein